MSDILFSIQDDWKGEPFELELRPCGDITKLPWVNQIQAVCVTPDDQVVFYKHVDGWFGLPGGRLEPGEDVEEGLRRELVEEAQVTLVDWKPLAYETIYSPSKAEPGETKYFVRAVARVEVIDAEIDDPDGKAIDRAIVSWDEAVEKLGWGEKGEIILRLAKKHKDI